MISENIRLLREERKISQKELAEILGVSNKTVSKWETGAGLPDINIIVPLSQALGVSTDEILKERPITDTPEDRPLNRKQKIQEALTHLQERYSISTDQLLEALRMNKSEFIMLVVDEYPSTKNEASKKQEKLVKLLIILAELIPMYIENHHMLISNLYTRLQNDNDLCAETIENYVGMKPGTLGKYLSGSCVLPPKQSLSLVIALFMLDQAFNPEDAFPRDL